MRPRRERGASPGASPAPPGQGIRGGRRGRGAAEGGPRGAAPPGNRPPAGRRRGHRPGMGTAKESPPRDAGTGRGMTRGESGEDGDRAGEPTPGCRHHLGGAGQTPAPSSPVRSSSAPRLLPASTGSPGARSDPVPRCRSCCPDTALPAPTPPRAPAAPGVGAQHLPPPDTEPTRAQPPALPAPKRAVLITCPSAVTDRSTRRCEQTLYLGVFSTSRSLIVCHQLKPSHSPSAPLCWLLISLKHLCRQLDELMTHATFQISPIIYSPLKLIVF